MLTLVGIDTSSYGFHCVANEPVLPGQLAWFAYDASMSLAQDRRLAMFHKARDLFNVLPRHSHVFVEEPLILPKNLETTRKLVMAGGMMEAAWWAAMPDSMFYWVDVSTWRRTVLGIGGGKREVMKGLAVDWVRNHRPELVSKVEESDDFADAACLCEYGRRSLEI
jgi:hypothetical protein